MTEGGTDNKNLNDLRTSLERYLVMNEQEKDAEIQKAVGRLQKRIQEILYMLDSEKQNIVGPEPVKKKD